MSGATPSETSLRIERLIPASPEALFPLWTDPSQLARWWAPDGYDARVETLDATPGGRWRIVLTRFDGVTAAMNGVYRIVEPPRRLAFTWAWEDEDGDPGHETEVMVTFEPTPGGARLVLLHQRFEDSRTRDRHDAGWSSAFHRLAQTAL